MSFVLSLFLVFAVTQEPTLEKVPEPAGETLTLELAQSAYARAASDPVVMDTLASLYLQQGLAARAAALLEKARRADAASTEIAYHLALAYRESQRPADARALLLDLHTRLEPEHALREPVDAALASLR